MTFPYTTHVWRSWWYSFSDTKRFKHIHSKWVNSGASMHLFFGKSAIFWCLNAPRSLRHVTHLKIVLCTTELALMTQRPFFLRLFCVILLSLCATFSWHHHHITIASIIKFAFSKMTGCTSLILNIDLFNLPSTLRTQSVSRNDAIWKYCLIYVLLCSISIKKFHDWLNIVAASNRSMFMSVVISEGLILVVLFIHIFAANSTTAIIFLIFIQLEDIISSFDVTVMPAFTMFSWSLFFNSGSSLFIGLIDCLSYNHVFSEDQRRAGSLNQPYILLSSS